MSDDPNFPPPPPPPPPPPGQWGQQPPPPPPGQWGQPPQGQWGQAPGGWGGPAASVPNYLVQSILVTLGCCLPVGIAAIVFAAQANSKQGAGDYAGAMSAANTAKMLCWVSFGLGIAAIVLFFSLGALGSAGSGY